MKFGVNTFIWTGSFDRSHIPLLAEIKAHGFDGAELPLFDPAALPGGGPAPRARSRTAWNAPSAPC